MITSTVKKSDKNAHEIIEVRSNLSMKIHAQIVYKHQGRVRLTPSLFNLYLKTPSIHGPSPILMYIISYKQFSFNMRRVILLHF